VIACVDFARDHDLRVAVRGGGYSVVGKAAYDDGLLIDLTTQGACSMVGLAGLTLGGGLGWLMGKQGFACDNLISVDIVTADGRLLTASEREHEDLFWGMQGGSGNEGRAIWLLRCEPMSVR
jgi:FAD/FMN-containing dehydrogenase